MAPFTHDEIEYLSEADFAITQIFLYCCSIFLGNVGKNKVHIFAYKKDAHLTKVTKVGNGTVRLHSTLAVVDADTLHGHPPFNPATQVCVCIFIRDTGMKIWDVTNVSDIQKIVQPDIECVLSYKVCANCGEKEKKLLSCANCQCVKYCCTECQRSDWRKHKAVCKVVTA